jgi:hypothetical protein
LLASIIKIKFLLASIIKIKCVTTYRVKLTDGVGNSECCAAVRGTTIRGTAVVRIATGTSVTTGTTTLGSGLFSFPPALLCVRIGGWEFTERTFNKSPDLLQ